MVYGALCIALIIELRLEIIGFIWVDIYIWGEILPSRNQAKQGLLGHYRILVLLI